MNLNGAVVAITGAKRVGAAVATTLARGGADVAIAYNRLKPEADAVAASVTEIGRRALVIETDVAQEASCDALIAAVGETFGRLDVLINMASLYRAVPFAELDAATWDRQLSIDLRGSFLCAKAAVPLMKRGGGGRIINFVDWVAASGRPRYKGYTAYYVAKAGVKALTEALALELAADNILVNAIAPGPVLAPDDSITRAAQGRRGRDAARPLGRSGRSREAGRRAHRVRLHHRRDRACRRRTAPGVGRQEVRSSKPEVRSS